jgi:hypothetical protein
MVENQIFKRPVPDHLTESMLNLACKSPIDHNRSIQNDAFKFLKVNGPLDLKDPTPVPFVCCFPTFNVNSCLTYHQKNCPALRISTPLLTVPSTALQYPIVRYASEEVYLNKEKDQSSWNLKGTTKPTHYFCLQDEMGLGALELQNITHEICYTYIRTKIEVSYVSPAYYTDRLCERGRAYLGGFLAGKSDIEATLEANKPEWEQELFAIRTSSYPKTQDADGKWPKKTKEELVMEHIHDEQVQKKCREYTMAAALTIWVKARGGSVEPEEPKKSVELEAG